MTNRGLLVAVLASVAAPALAQVPDLYDLANGGPRLPDVPPAQPLAAADQRLRAPNQQRDDAGLDSSRALKITIRP